MQVTKESELTAAILNYAMRCVIEGDQLALRQMNIGEREVDAIGKLSLLDLQRLESLKTHCLNISLNSQVFWPIIDHVQRIREEDHMIRSLLVADAPFEMINSLYGMSSREFTARRKGLLRKTNVGRSSLPSSEEEMVLYQLWLDMDRDLKLENMGGKHYLKLFRETKLPLRSIWYLTQRWRDYPQNSAK